MYVYMNIYICTNIEYIYYNYYYIIADRWRVSLKGEYPNYIHASFINVSLFCFNSLRVLINRREIIFSYTISITFEP